MFLSGSDLVQPRHRLTSSLHDGSPAGEVSGAAAARPLRAPGAATKVWRRKSPCNSVPVSELSAGEVVGSEQAPNLAIDEAVAARPEAGMGDGERRKRRRRRPRFRQPAASSLAADPAASVSTLVAPPEAHVLPVQSPPCIIC